VAEVLVVFAMTDQSKGTKGISAFIVENTFPGFSVGKHEEKMGLHGSPTAEIVFTRLHRSQGKPAGQRGQGLQHRHGHAGRRPDRHRGAVPGHR
jgi:butyryl-CoA dehydrogenase